MRESAIESKICRHAEKHGMLAFKFTSPFRRGVPDRVFVGPNGTLFLEVKAPGKRPTPQQMRVMEQIVAAGGRAAWVDNVEDGITLVNSLR